MKTLLGRHRSHLLTSLVLIGLIAFLASRRSDSWAPLKSSVLKLAPAKFSISDPPRTEQSLPLLPPHFPVAESIDLAMKTGDDSDRSFTAALKRCWPTIAPPQDATDNEPIAVDFRRIESFFGKIKHREAIEASRVGLLFDNSVFKTGAAGSATEKNGKIKEFRLRAGGRNLSCIENRADLDDNESQLDCDCF